MFPFIAWHHTSLLFIHIHICTGLILGQTCNANPVGIANFVYLWENSSVGALTSCDAANLQKKMTSVSKSHILDLTKHHHLEIINYWKLLACSLFNNDINLHKWLSYIFVIIFTKTKITITYVTVLGYPPLSRPVARRRSSSPTGLGYWCYASTYLLKRIANGGPKGSHLNPPSNGALAPARAPRMRAPPNFSIKAVHTAPRGSLMVSRWLSHT